MFLRWTLLVLVVLVSRSEGFFNVSSLSGESRRSNLTCLSSTRGLTFASCELCIIEFFYDGSTSNDSSLVRYHCAHQLNAFRRKSRRCSGFSNQSDLGYGLCSPLPYETFDVNVLCICATDLCNVNINYCRQSVIDNQLSLPSALPSIVPQLNQSISCSQIIRDPLDPLWKCPLAELSPFVNQTACYESFLQTVVLCEYQAHQSGELLTPKAYSMENYEYLLDGLLLELQEQQRMNFTVFVNQTKTSFFTVFALPNLENATYSIQRCFCFEQNCNQNLTLCLNNLNQTEPLSKFLFLPSNFFVIRLLLDQSNRISSAFVHFSLVLLILFNQ